MSKMIWVWRSTVLILRFESNIFSFFQTYIPDSLNKQRFNSKTIDEIIQRDHPYIHSLDEAFVLHYIHKLQRQQPQNDKHFISKLCLSNWLLAGCTLLTITENFAFCQTWTCWDNIKSTLWGVNSLEATVCERDDQGIVSIIATNSTLWFCSINREAISYARSPPYEYPPKKYGPWRCSFMINCT